MTAILGSGRKGVMECSSVFLLVSILIQERVKRKPGFAMKLDVCAFGTLTFYKGRKAATAFMAKVGDRKRSLLAKTTLSLLFFFLSNLET